MVAYTDGSKEKEDIAAGAGWVGYWCINKIKIFCRHHEVFDAEAIGALLGLQTALKDPP